MIIGGYFADFCKDNDIVLGTKVAERELERQDKYIDYLLSLDGDEKIYDIKDRMRVIMPGEGGNF